MLCCVLGTLNLLVTRLLKSDEKIGTNLTSPICTINVLGDYFNSSNREEAQRI